MTSAKDRFIAELKQSPGKAAVLGIGAVAAAIVWGGQLSGASSKVGKGPSSADPSDPGAAAGVVDEIRSDPETIRLEFEQILEEARSLRRFAEPVHLAASDGNPFLQERAVEPQRVIPPVPPPVDVDDREATEEREHAERIHVDGVFLFKSARRAILDGAVRDVGDEHEGFVVVRIDGRTVTLRGKHSDHELSMDSPKGGR